MSVLSPSLAAGSPPASARADERAIGLWLVVVTAMIFVMIVIGALTRLTESGLSMVEWRPVTGWLPPLSEAAWQAELAKYAASPQGRIVNHGIGLDEFKQIFWLEYFHRLWGRIIGLAFALPFAWFMIRRRVPRWLVPRLIVLLALGGLQGAIGWIMVASGLRDVPAVSHYKLAMHLTLAVALFAYIVWLSLTLLSPPGTGEARRGDAAIATGSRALIGALFVVLTWGAFVAGLRAGHVHTTFPTMSGYWLPPGLFDLSPLWRNFVETQAGVQFAHRWLAKALVLGIALFWWRARRDDVSPAVRRATNMVAVMAALQFALGIATILSGTQIALATLHQAGAVLLLSTLVLTLRRSVMTRPQ